VSGVCRKSLAVSTTTARSAVTFVLLRTNSSMIAEVVFKFPSHGGVPRRGGVVLAEYRIILPPHCHHPVRLCFERHTATTPSGFACHPSRGGELSLEVPSSHFAGLFPSHGGVPRRGGVVRGCAVVPNKYRMISQKPHHSR
jgi:hypothetical protein